LYVLVSVKKIVCTCLKIIVIIFFNFAEHTECLNVNAGIENINVRTDTV